MEDNKIDIWTTFIYHESMGINQAVSKGGNGRLISGGEYRMRWRYDGDYIGIYGDVYVEETDGSGMMIDAGSCGWILHRISEDQIDRAKLILSTIVEWKTIR